MEKIIKLITIVLMAFTLSSCVVLHEEYFFPKAIGGKVEKEWCRGHVGVDNQLIFSFNDVEVKMDVWENQSITRLGISFKLHSKSEVIWPQQPLFVTTSSSQTSIEVKSFDRLIRTGNDITSEAYPVDTIMTKKDNLDYDTFYESFIVSEDNIESIEVSAFNLIINGKQEQIPLSVFSKKSGLFLHPLNC